MFASAVSQRVWQPAVEIVVKHGVPLIVPVLFAVVIGMTVPEISRRGLLCSPWAISIARTSWPISVRALPSFAFVLAIVAAEMATLDKRAMIEITTRSSMTVNPRILFFEKYPMTLFREESSE